MSVQRPLQLLSAIFGQSQYIFFPLLTSVCGQRMDNSVNFYILHFSRKNAILLMQLAVVVLEAARNLKHLYAF